MEEHVIEGFSPPAGSLDEYTKIVLCLRLPDVFIQSLGPKGEFPLIFRHEACPGQILRQVFTGYFDTHDRFSPQRSEDLRA